ncbi:MAG: M20/M25/M40 family metallo-hydrolase [Chloroflexi bacterium]|nr:M20/M25/M40 family metallo-hydrolase [Chloroflexota bacterium]
MQLDYPRVLQELVSIDTSVPPGRNYERAIEYLEPFFRAVGCETMIVPLPPEFAGGQTGRVNLLAHRRAPGKQRLIFYGHVDVVPAEGWAAFEPRLETGRLYGRGAADMKGGIVALLLGLQALVGKPLRYDVSAMITTDEEVGQADQVRYLGRFLAPLSGAYLFSLDSDFGFVSVAALGAIHAEIRVLGKSVHSAMSHMGENAVEKANLLMNALVRLKERVVQRQSSVETHPSTGLTRMVPRLNINMVRGGIKVNILPDECLLSIDRRLIPEEDLKEAEQELLGALSSVPDVRWEVVRMLGIPTVPPCNDPVTEELSEVIRDVTGSSGRFGTMGSGDFGPVVSLEWRARHFGSGVIRPECNIHGKDEFVYLQDIERLGTVIARFAASA